MSYLLLTPTRCDAIASGTADVQGLSARPGLILMGFSVTEDAATAAAAEVIIRHGTSTSGEELYGVTLSADQSTREWCAPNGIQAHNGIFIDRVSGTTKLTLFWAVP